MRLGDCEYYLECSSTVAVAFPRHVPELHQHPLHRIMIPVGGRREWDRAGL